MNRRQRKKRSRPWLYNGRWRQVSCAKFVRVLGPGTAVNAMVDRLHHDGLLIGAHVSGKRLEITAVVDEASGVVRTSSGVKHYEGPVTIVYDVAELQGSSAVSIRHGHCEAGAGACDVCDAEADAWAERDRALMRQHMELVTMPLEQARAVLREYPDADLRAFRVVDAEGAEVTDLDAIAKQEAERTLETIKAIMHAQPCEPCEAISQTAARAIRTEVSVTLPIQLPTVIRGKVDV